MPTPRPRTNSMPRAAAAPARARATAASSRAQVTRNRIVFGVAIVALLAVACLAFYGVDSLVHRDRVYGNVTAGGVDVGGMTQVEAASAIAERFEPVLQQADVFVYANEEAMQRQARNEFASTDDTASVAQEHEDTVVWQTNARSLGAYIPYRELAEQALEQGRGGFLDRLSLRFSARDLPVGVTMDAANLETLAALIDDTIGNPYLNYGVDVEDGHASVTEGHDGNMVDRGELKDRIGALLLQEGGAERAMVAHAEYTPVLVDQAQAQRTADAVNQAIGAGATFVYGDESWSFSAQDIGDCVRFDLAVQDGEARLLPSIDDYTARPKILSHVGSAIQADGMQVSMEREGDELWVTTTTSGQMPNTSQAATQLDSSLFDAFREDPSQLGTGTAPVITVGTTDVPQRMTFDDALSFGVVGLVSTFTTEYTSSAEARNTNIHLASDKIDGSIVKAQGGVWSFNGTVGETTVEDGYQVAGVVVGNQHDEDIGGGICQVATTIFNAVFEAGYPVLERRNHSIYIAAYPEGRDAAVSWEYPDLKWENDTESDVLVRMSYTDNTVTAQLYGVDPGRRVESESSDWEEGEPYSTVYEYDEDLPEGETYDKQEGSDGRIIYVWRTVYDAYGTELFEDEFESVYRPHDHIIAIGSGGSSYDDDGYDDYDDPYDDEDEEG